MFDIGWGELVVIGIVALIVIGPKELPTVLRTVGQWATKIRRMASEFQGQFQEAMREAEFADLKKQVDSIGDSARDLTTGGFDPLGTAKKEIEGVFEEKPPTPAGDTPAATSAPEQTTVTAEAAPSAGNEPAPAQPAPAAPVASADPFGPPPDLPPPVTERDFAGESASTSEKSSPPHPEAGGGRAA
jgi:sec-independent protein translocase protein TatB